MYVGPETPGIYFLTVTFNLTVLQNVFELILEMVFLRLGKTFWTD
jgi:hypothetical protein